MQHKSRYTSDIFYHFVGRKHPTYHKQNYDDLHTILSSGRVSYWPHNEPGWGKTEFVINWDKSLLSQDLIVPTVTCYADIPFDDLGIHTKKYGQFGIGFEKRLVIYYGARPVMYVPYAPEDRFQASPYGMDLLQDLEQIFRSFNKATDQICEGKSIRETRILKTPAGSPEEAISEMHSMFGKDFLAFVKAFDCTLADDDPANYYMEREWRKYQYLRFEPDQVREVIVAHGFGERVIKEFPVYAKKVIELDRIAM
jgi:hypothetical protein